MGAGVSRDEAPLVMSELAAIYGSAKTDQEMMLKMKQVIETHLSASAPSASEPSAMAPPGIAPAPKDRPTTPETVPTDNSSYQFDSRSNSIKSEIASVVFCQQPAAVVEGDDCKYDDDDAAFESLRSWAEEFSLDIDCDDLDNVTDLDLSENDLDALPDALRLLANNLTEMALEKNSLTDISNIRLHTFTNLTELYLRDNQLTSLPTGIGSCVNLDSLYLENNLLTTLPATMGGLKNLKGLCLHRNQFVAAPLSLFDCVGLEELYLDGNAITGCLPAELGNLVNLTELGLANNKLGEGSGGEAFPETIGLLKNMHTLHAESNQIVELPKNFGRCKAMRRLYLNDNKMAKLHACIGKCPKLEIINVEDNEINKLAKRIKDLPLLRFLLLANNKLVALDFNPGECAPGLRRLSLAGNQLDEATMKLEKLNGMGGLDEGEEEREED